MGTLLQQHQVGQNGSWNLQETPLCPYTRPLAAPMVREYRESDLESLLGLLGGQEFDFELPPFDDPLYLERLVVEAGGVVEMVGGARLTAEIYVLGDRRLAPRAWIERLQLIERECVRRLKEQGLDEMHGWLQPCRAKAFGKLLERLGWVRDDLWPVYTRHF